MNAGQVNLQYQIAQTRRRRRSRWERAKREFVQGIFWCFFTIGVFSAVVAIVDMVRGY